jgi:16S rRNA (guanine527-N7)-methyltransferase
VDLEEACAALGLRLSPQQTAALVRYRDLLVEYARRLDVVAPAPPEEVLRAHVLDSLLLLVVADPGLGAWVADVGSGGGLPGVVWAVARPDLHLVLVEPRRKRAAFLERVVLELELPNAEVEASRAEEASKDPRYARRFDVVVARAVAPPLRVLRMAKGLLKEGGRLVVPVGPTAEVPPPFVEARRPVPWDPGRTRRVAVASV